MLECKSVARRFYNTDVVWVKPLMTFTGMLMNFYCYASLLCINTKFCDAV